MALVVFGEQEALLDVLAGAALLEMLAQLRFWNSFSLSHTGTAMRNEVKPLGANAR